MAYDAKTNKTHWPAASNEYCKGMADKYNWPQPKFPEPTYELTRDPILCVNCIFIGNCQFPKSRMDLTQGECDD